MSTKIGRLSLLSGALGSLLALGTPAFAQHGGGGGGHGGGGHMGGGAHSFSGGGGHAPAAHGYAGGVGHAGYSGGYGGGHVSGGYAGHPGGYGGRPAGYSGGYYHGYSTGAYWNGGYWHGGYWPRAYYGVGFSWFLPVLPLAYATYWYGSVPYYYANDVYYTWNPSYDGYVATDPPPVGDSSGAAAAPADQVQGDPQAAGAPPPAGQVFMYPKNGQSEEQQSTDKRECQQWASSQANPQNPDDYRRAMMACIEGRGYSAQ